MNLHLRFFFIISLVFFSTLAEAQRVQRINGNFTGVSFASFVESVEQQSDYRFYLKKEWVDSLTVNVNATNERVEDVLGRILEGTDLHFAIDHFNVYITRDRRIMVDLPIDFFNDDTRIADTRDRQTFDYSDYEKQEKKRKIAESKLFSIGNKNASPQGNAVLAGSIRDVSTGEPVIGATIFIEKLSKGVTTDQFGYYSITLPKGRHEMRVKSIGMKATVRQIMLYSDGKLDVNLEQDVTPLKEVVVESQHEARITSLQMGTEKLDIQTMKQIPLALGETDVMKVILALPGVQSVGEGTVGINVRGGATNQNLILLNDAVVYNPSHLFGFFSTFNPDILKNVELYKSGIKSEYGGRLSSVLDVHTREGNTKEFSGSGGISPITGRLSLEGPIIKEKTSFIIGVRSTYSNWILRQLDDPALSRSKASFYDITAGITHKINESNDIYLSGYQSNDAFNLDNDTTYMYSDRNGSLKWKHIFNNKLVGVVTGSFSNYKYRMSSDKNPVNAFQMDFNIRQAGLKADFNYFLDSKNTLDAGVSSTRYFVSPGMIRPNGPQSLQAREEIQQEHGLENALYVSDNIDVNQNISVYLGLRYSMYQYLGPKDVFGYNESGSRGEGNIVDTVSYPRGKTIAHYGGLEPRIALRYTITENLAVKLSYNRMRQYIQMLSNTTAITPTDIWKLSDSYIKPQVGDQVSIGLYKNITGKNFIETSVEGYYKKMGSTIDYRNGAVLLLNQTLEADVIPAEGTAYGIELLVKKNAGKVNGWVSYAYSRSFLKTTGQHPDQMVNGGRSYPSNFDKPHAVNFIGNYKFSRRFNFSMNFIYSTGRPITLPIAKYDVAGSPKIYYSDRNAYRIPDYFRTDISINMEGNHKIKKLAHSSWTLAVYNLTGRKNAYSVFFTSENGQIKGYKLAVFGQAIPTLTYNFKF